MALTYINYINLSEAFDHKDQINIENVQVPNKKKIFMSKNALSVDMSCP